MDYFKFEGRDVKCPPFSEWPTCFQKPLTVYSQKKKKKKSESPSRELFSFKFWSNQKAPAVTWLKMTSTWLCRPLLDIRMQHTMNLLPMFGNRAAVIIFFFKKVPKNCIWKFIQLQMPVAVTHKHEVLLLKIIFRKSPAFDWHTFPNFPKLPRHVKSPPTAVLPLPGSSSCPPLSRLLPCRAPRSADRTRQKQNFPSLLQGHNLVVTGERWDVIERRSSGDRPDERGGGQTCEPALRSGAAQLQGAQRSSALVSRC